MGQRGGKRDGAGRRKVERPTDSGVAARVLAKVDAENQWTRIITVERARIDADPQKASTAALRETLKYLECRHLGNCTDNVNHMHDKPLEINATLTISEIVREVRERKEKYERSR